jgi:hypothetical protein
MATDSYIDARLKICNGCEFNVAGDCALCGCIISEKVQKPDEKCPAIPSRWGSLTSLSEPEKAGQMPGCIPCSKKR